MKRQVSPQVLLFAQLFVMANGKRSAADCWREAHQKEAEEQDYCHASRALKREPVIRYMEGIRSSPAYRRMQEANERYEQVREELENATALMQNSVVERKHIVAFWEQVLCTGAKRVLDDIHNNEGKKFGHLVEEFTVTKDSIKIKLPSKKDASAVLTVLKRLDAAGPEKTVLSEPATEEFRKRLAGQPWQKPPGEGNHLLDGTWK